MSYFEKTLLGKQIDAVMSDSEVTYLMLSDGTQVTIHGLVIVQPCTPSCRTLVADDSIGRV